MKFKRNPKTSKKELEKIKKRIAKAIAKIEKQRSVDWDKLHTPMDI